MYGLHRGQIKRVVLILSHFVLYFWWFVWFIIGLKWLLKAWGHIPIFVWTLLELPKYRKNWTMNPWVITKIVLKYKKSPSHFYETYCFTYLDISQIQSFQHIGKCGTPFLKAYFPKVVKHIFREVRVWKLFSTTTIFRKVFFRYTFGTNKLFQVRESLAFFGPPL